jgi:hypothetical protein
VLVVEERAARRGGGDRHLAQAACR